MPFKKGQIANPVGRPKGSVNKISTEQRDFLREFLIKNKKKLVARLKKMEGKDFVQNYVTLMQYVLPKPSSAEVKEVPQPEQFIAMTPEERQAAINEIQASLKRENEKSKTYFAFLGAAFIALFFSALLLARFFLAIFFLRFCFMVIVCLIFHSYGA